MASFLFIFSFLFFLLVGLSETHWQKFIFTDVLSLFTQDTSDQDRTCLDTKASVFGSILLIVKFACCEKYLRLNSKGKI